MSDFVAHIVAQLDASKAEAQIQALTKKRVVDIEFNITNDLNSAFQKQFGGSGQSGFSKIGQQAGQAYAKSFYKGYFANQKWVADQAKVLQKQFPKARDNAQADGFYKSAVRARDKEIERQRKAEERQLAEGRKAADQQYKYLNDREVAYQKQRARYIEQGRKQEQAIIRQNQQQVENYARRYGNGKYDADFAVMQSNLEKYGNQSTPGMDKANEALEKYRDTLAQIKQHFDPNEVFQFDKDSDLINAFDDLDNAAERYKNAMREVGVETTKALKPGQNIQKSNDIINYYNNNTKAIKKYGNELKALAQEAQNASTVGELDDINQRFNTLKSTISAEGLTGRSIFSEIGRGFKQIAQFVGTYGLIQQIPQTVMKMAGETIKVDSAITELRKVSDASDAELANSFTKATAAAKEYGVAISDVIQTTADWKRLGYTLDEAEKLADATTLLQRVGDNMTQESASQAIISTMRGFQLDINQVNSVIDKYNEVANREPIDTAGMAEAIERSASSMSAAGNTLEETMGLIAAANSVVQDPKSIGTAFKTISMRIRGAKTELEEMGEDTTGMVESTAKLRSEIQALTGVDIMKNEQEFKSTYDILDELSRKWQDLTDIQQASVTELIAGKRQGNIISALMTNFDTARETVNIAMNEAEGSATRELENYQRSVEYSIGQFKAAFQELSTTVINSDFLKGLIDAGTKAVEILTKLISLFGNLKTAIAGLAIGKAAFTFAKGFDSFKAIGSAISLIGKGGSNNITGIAKALSVLDESAQQSAVSLLKISDGEKAAVLAMNGIKTATAEVSQGATQMSTGLAGIGAALKGFITAHPFITAAAGIGAVVAIIATYKQRLEEVKEQQREIAETAGNEWKEQADSIEESINRVIELRTSIDSGELNDEEALAAKKEILSIQQQIVDLYGSQAQGIDLVNGKLDTQLTKIRNITREEAERVKAENLAAFNDAKDMLGKSFNEASGNRGTQYLLGEFATNAVYTEDLQEIISKYSSKGLSVGQLSFMDNLPVYFEGTTEEALNVFSDFMVDLMNLQEKYDLDLVNNPADPLSFLYNTTVSGKRSAEAIVNEYKPVFDLFEQLSVYTDPKKYGFMGNAKTAQEWVDAYTNAVTDLNEALISGKGIEEARANFTAIDDELRGMVSGGAMKEYSSTFESIKGQLNEAALAAYDFEQALSGKDTEEPKLFSSILEGAKDGSKVLAETKEEAKEFSATLGDSLVPDEWNPFGNTLTPLADVAQGAKEANKEVPKTTMSINEAAQALQKLNLTDVDLGNMFMDSGLQKGEEYFNALINAALEYGMITDVTADGIQPLIDQLLELGIISNYVAEEVEQSAEEISNAYNDAITGSQNSLSEISNAMSLLTSGTTGKSVDASLFDSAEMLGYASALEYVNGTIQVNQEKVRELAKAQADEQIQANETAKALKQQEWLDNAHQIEELNAKLKENMTLKEKESILNEIDGLTASNNAIANQCAQLDLYSQALRESTGAYQAWLAAQSGGSEGDMARDVETAMSAINSVFDSENEEMYHRFGNNKYEAAVEFLVPDTVSSEGQEAVKAYIDNLGTYFGSEAGANKFIEEAIDKGLMESDPEKGVKVAAGKTMEEFAKEFNWTDEAMQAMFGELTEYYPEFNFEWAKDDGTMSGLAMNAHNAAQALQELEGNEDLSIDIDVSDLETTEEKISAIDDTIQQMNDIKAKPGVDASEVENANSVIEYCVAQKQQLEAPAIMHLSVEDSGVSEEMQNALSLLQEFQTAQNTVQMQAAVGADTSEAQGQVDALVGEIEGLSPEIKATLGLGEGVTAESIQAAIGELTVDAMVDFGVNRQAIDDQEWDDTGIITFGVDRSEVDAQNWDDTGTITYSANTSSLANQLAPYLVQTGRINYSVSVTGLPSGLSGGNHSLNGTAHASGTAKAQGDWGNKTPGKTLVGELGTEIVVDPNSGKWHTVGDNGAEFISLPKNAIVFNHLQSKALLERGFVFGRGTAMVSGNAKATQVKSDYVQLRGAGSSTTTTPPPDPAPATAALTQFTGAVEAGTGAVTDNTGSTETNTDSKKKEKTLAEKMADMYDWVAVRLEYFGDKTKAIADRITDYISDTRKTYLLDKQMKATQNEIGANFTGARLYKEQADKVATDTQMSDDLVRKARTGAWQFEELSEEDEDKVKAYLKYYDGYKEAIEKTRELKAAQQELFEQWANMPTETAEKKVEKLTNRIENLQGAYSVASSGASGLNTYNKVVNAQLISAQKNVRKAQKRENKAVDRATKALNKYTNATEDLKNYGNLLTKNVGKKNSIPDDIKSKISEAVASDTRISLSSGEMKRLPSSIKNQIDKYNKKLANEQNLGNVATSVADYAQNARAETKNAKSRVKDIKKNQTNVQKAAAKYANNVSYKGQNALLDAQVKDQKKVVNTYNSALKKTQDNVEKAAKKADTTAKKAENAKNVLKSTGDNLLGNFGKDLTSKQKKAVKSGKMVDTKGLTGETLEAVKKYNEAVTKSQNANSKASNASVNYNTALKAQETATQSLTAAQTEYAQMIIDNEKQKFDNVKNYYEAQINYQNALTESYAKDRQLKEKQGKDTTKNDYQKEIKSIGEEREFLVKEQNDLRKQLADSVASGIIKKGSEEWNNMRAEIIGVGNSIDDLDMEVLDLQDEMRNEVFYRALNKALKEAEKLRDAISTIGDLLHEEMMFDTEGNITDMGITALAMNIDTYESNLGTLATLLDKRNEMIKNYNNGRNSTNYSQKEFEADMEEITGEIQNVLKSADSARGAILDMIAKISKAELDATLKVIDARKKLLQSQKDYYDYDKTLKGKTKDLQLLDQQIAALDGVTDAESRAMKARLEAQREEAQMDLDDTVREHTFQLQVNGLDELKTELQENYDNYIHDLNGNLEKIVSAVDGATSSVNGMLGTVKTSIDKLLESYGVNGLTANVVGLKGYASGTRRAGRNGWALTNERGGEMVITDQGIYMPLSQNSGVIPADLTSKIFGLTENYSAIMGGLGSEYISGNNKANDGRPIAPVVNCPITITGNQIDEQGVIRAINKQMPVISKRVQSDIRKDLSKSR